MKIISSTRISSHFPAAAAISVLLFPSTGIISRLKLKCHAPATSLLFNICPTKKGRRERETISSFVFFCMLLSLYYSERKECVGAVNTGRKRGASVFIKNYYCEREEKRKTESECCERSVLSFAQRAEMESVFSY